MGKVQFEVSAKTARLIGRENISDVDGAIVELIKNSYDADATCVFVLFNMPFPVVPKTITYETTVEKELNVSDLKNAVELLREANDLLGGQNEN